jgi:anti-sigma factor RsiW
MMTCEELTQLLPDLVDGTLSEVVRTEAEGALQACPECQRELDIARRVRAFLVELQAEYTDVYIPEGFEARLLARVRSESQGLELLNLSSQAFALWLLELLLLLGGLFRPTPQPSGA